MQCRTQRIYAEILGFHIEEIGRHTGRQTQIGAHAVHIVAVLPKTLPVYRENQAIGIAPSAGMIALIDGMRGNSLQIGHHIRRMQTVGKKTRTDAVVFHHRLCLHRHRHRGQ